MSCRDCHVRVDRTTMDSTAVSPPAGCVSVMYVCMYTSAPPATPRGSASPLWASPQPSFASRSPGGLAARPCPALAGADRGPTLSTVALRRVSILYQRGLYDSETFERHKKYGLQLMVTSDQGLLDYLGPVLRQISGEYRETPPRDPSPPRPVRRADTHTSRQSACCWPRCGRGASDGGARGWHV